MAEEQKQIESQPQQDEAGPNDGQPQGGNNNKLEDANMISLGRVEKKKTQKSMYTPPEPKTTRKYAEEEKNNMELSRGWKILIEDIEIRNETENPISPFIRFTLGGNYHIRIKELADKSRSYEPQGQKGVVQMTHVINLLERQGEQVFDSILRADLEASYFQLMEQHIHVEVWNANSYKLNTYLGYESLRLLDVASGSNRQELNIYNKTERDGLREGDLVCTLKFKLIFEEVWHYMSLNI